MKYIDAEKLKAEIVKRLKNIRDYINGAGVKHKGPAFYKARGKESAYDALLSIITSLQKEKREVSIECGVRVYPKLDGKPRPWVSLYGRGIGLVSFRDLPELESLGFKDDDTAIITIAKKEESK